MRPDQPPQCATFDEGIVKRFTELVIGECLRTAALQYNNTIPVEVRSAMRTVHKHFWGQVMNERIKQFATQVGATHNTVGNEPVKVFTEEALNEFVSLIVQECLALVDEVVANATDVQVQLGAAKTRISIADHFVSVL